MPAFCRVGVTAKPTVDSDIKVEVWVPSAWNGKLLGTDNGGFSGAINYGALANAIAKGYAAVSTDTGHTGDQMDFGIGHPEKIADWAHRAVHEMTVIAKAVVERVYGRAPLRSYFSGCSTGGRQALSEAQRYPADYDGIIAGAPGNNRINLIYGFLWSWLATHDAGGKATLPAAKLPALARAAVAACDKQDGLEDGVIDDPRACRFDPAALACTAAETDSCLTAPQIEAVAKVYAGARARAGGSCTPDGRAAASPGGDRYITNPGVPVRIALFRDWVFENPKWDPRTFDWDKDVATVDAAWPMLNAISTDYTAFNARGGKLILYTGLADPVVSPLDTIDPTSASSARTAASTRHSVSIASSPFPEWRTVAAAAAARARSTLSRRSRHGWSAAPRRTASPHLAQSTGASIARGRCAHIRPSPATGDPEASMTRRTSPVPRRGSRRAHAPRIGYA